MMHFHLIVVPRPNVMVYLSPIHLNLHQESCLWLVEFVHGVVRTVNIELALSVKDEGQSFLVSVQLIPSGVTSGGFVILTIAGGTVCAS